MSDDPYLYPSTQILRNKLGLRDAARLDAFERLAVMQRIAEGVPQGDFALGHLRAIHRHLFQDIYDWAGEVRRVPLAKGGDRFQHPRFIPTGMADVHARLIAADFLRGLASARFAEIAAQILGDVNDIHPFREGNGRTQLQYFKLLAETAAIPPILRGSTLRAGWPLRAAHTGEYGLMAAEIEATPR